ncbi:MAG: tyrosine-type recombinase/integrase [Sedimentibacter sp.]
MNDTLHSFFKENIEDLINQKHAFGYPYTTSSHHLINFDRFCYANYPQEKVLSKEIVLKWTQLHDSEHENGRKRRISALRELAKFMNRNGIEAYILPNDWIGKEKQYVPHIFTREELTAFFAAADSFEYNKLCPARHLVIPVIFRVIYCCGLRPGEALNLKIENVYLDKGQITVLESKGHKSRHVMLSESVLNLCRKYREKSQYIFPNSEYFFPNHQGNSYSISRLDDLFWKCWNIADIKNSTVPSPRPYDFRHTFTTECINQWMKEGKDLNAWLPYLSSYLGHEHYSSTLYYFHLVPEFFPNMAKMNVEIPSDLISKVRI